MTDLGALSVAYLQAYLFWLGLTLGSLAIVLLNNLVGGEWGKMTRSPLIAASALMPWMAILFIPIILGMKYLYLWTNPAIVSHDPLLLSKVAYLNTPFFLIRAAVYFIIWIGLSRYATRSKDLHRRLKLVSGLGLVAYGITITFAATDWVQSLDPRWYSSAFGVLWGVGQMLSALAFSAVVSVWRQPKQIQIQAMHDLGNLILAFVMLWAYIAFSQYLILWSGNIPDEFRWYHDRYSAGWQVVAWSLILFHFALPFCLLLIRSVKRHPIRIGLVALFILCMRFVEIEWQVSPIFGWGPLSHASLFLFVLMVLGFFWVPLFLRRLAA